MRWWEFYAVRYAMGTVVGAVMLWLLFSLSPSLRPLLLGAADSGTSLPPLMKLGVGQLLLLGIGGLVFCYVASAPILVFHSGRFLFVNGTAKLGRWWIRCQALGISAGLSIWLVAKARPADAKLAPGLLIFLLLLIVVKQWVLSIFTLANPKLMFAFYDLLAKARQRAGGGITDSYRHLREQGTPFFIVLLEVLLGLLLIRVGTMTGPDLDEAKPYLFLIIFVVWTAPAVSVWLAATLLEREFGQSSPNAPAPPSQSVASVGFTPALQAPPPASIP